MLVSTLSTLCVVFCVQAVITKLKLEWIAHHQLFTAERHCDDIAEERCIQYFGADSSVHLKDKGEDVMLPRQTWHTTAIDGYVAKQMIVTGQLNCETLLSGSCSLKPKLAVLVQTSTSIARDDKIVWLAVNVPGGQNLHSTTIYWQVYMDVHNELEQFRTQGAKVRLCIAARYAVGCACSSAH
jgi:hypothetical protein